MAISVPSAGILERLSVKILAMLQTRCYIWPHSLMFIDTHHSTQITCKSTCKLKGAEF